MRVKIIVRLFAVLSICMIPVACTSTTGPDNDVDSPKEKQISVQYIRQPPIDYESGDIVTLRWNYTGYTGAQGMTRISEDNFSCGAQIRTETNIYLICEDWRKYRECNYYTRKRLFIDGKELVFDGSNCGSVEFIYHNDGSIEVTSPK